MLILRDWLVQVQSKQLVINNTWVINFLTSLTVCQSVSQTDIRPFIRHKQQGVLAMVCLSVCLSLSAIQVKFISYRGTLPRSPSFQKANPPHLACKNHHYHRPTGFAALGPPQAPHPGPCHLLSVWHGHLLSGPGPAHSLSPVVATWGLTCLLCFLLHATDSVDTVNARWLTQWKVINLFKGYHDWLLLLCHWQQNELKCFIWQTH